MNEGDVYILDVGEIFYVWNGKESNRTERIKVRSNDERSSVLFVFGGEGDISLTMLVLMFLSRLLLGRTTTLLVGRQEGHSACKKHGG